MALTRRAELRLKSPMGAETDEPGGLFALITSQNFLYGALQVVVILWRAALCGRGAQNIEKRAFEQIWRHITVRLWRIIDLRSGFPNGECMIERYFVKPSTVDRIRGSWLAPEIERYVEWMASQGYAIRNFYRRVPILCQFAEFAKLHGATDVKSAASHIEAFASDWLASHGSKCTVAAAQSKIAEEARNPVRQMLRLAMEGSVAAARTRKSFPFADQAPGFLQHLQEERGLHASTIYKYVHRLNGFADYLKRLRRQVADGIVAGAARRLL